MSKVAKFPSVVLFLALASYPIQGMGGGTSTDGGGSAAVCFPTVSEAQKVRDARGSIDSELWLQLKDRITGIHSLDFIEESSRKGSAYDVLQVESAEKEALFAARDIGTGIEAWLRQARLVEFDREKVELRNLILDRLPKMRFVPINGPVKQMSDSGWRNDTLRLIPTVCAIVTVAYQRDIKSMKMSAAHDFTLVEVDSRIFEHPKHLHPSRRALGVHETLYPVARQLLRHRDSAWIRNWTARLCAEGL